MNTMLENMLGNLLEAGERIAFAIIVILVGVYVIRKLMKKVDKLKDSKRFDPTFKAFLLNAIRIGLYAGLVIAAIGILGVPLASISAVVGSVFIAIGMSMQGSLGNLAGGIMLLIFRPFRVGDYVDTGNAAGIVKEISLFYTVLTTPNQVRVMVPNGTMMNSNVTNYSMEPERRVDLSFSCAREEDVDRVLGLIRQVIEEDPDVNHEKEGFLGITAATDQALTCTAWVWTQSPKALMLGFRLTENIMKAFAREGVKAPGTRILGEDPASPLNSREK